MNEYEVQLKAIVWATPWLVTALRAVQDVGPTGAYVAAGAIRDTVWNWVTHRTVAKSTGDVDVVYWDPTETSDGSTQYTEALRHHLSVLRWEVTNQAWIHRWNQHLGVLNEPHSSVEDGISSWPETATAVGVRLNSGEIDVVAPFGLEDLFGLIVRYNPVRATAAEYEARIAMKRWAHRWPELQILPPEHRPNIGLQPSAGGVDVSRRG